MIFKPVQKPLIIEFSNILLDLKIILAYLTKTIDCVFCKIRTVNHRLPIECSRWQNFERENWKCNLCNSDIGDEIHYILKCPFSLNERKPYIKKNLHWRPNILCFKETLSSKNKQLHHKQELEHLYNIYTIENNIFWEISKDYQFQKQYKVWSELVKEFSIYSATYEKSPTIRWLKSHNSGMKNWNFPKKYTDHKTINSNNYVKLEVNWPIVSQFTARHTKNRL